MTWDTITLRDTKHLTKEPDDKEALCYIKVEDNIYKIKWTVVRNRAINNYNKVEQQTAKNGLPVIEFMEKTCHLCAHNQSNFMNYSAGQADEVNISPSSCSYTSNNKISIASRYKHRDSGKMFYALEPPCILSETMVLSAHEWIQNTKQPDMKKTYKVEMDFNFRPLTDFDKGLVTLDDFLATEQLTGIKKEPTLIERIANYFLSTSS